jgi:hypothetical protein
MGHDHPKDEILAHWETRIAEKEAFKLLSARYAATAAFGLLIAR